MKEDIPDAGGEETVLVCSGRTEIRDAVMEAFERLSAAVTSAPDPEAWPAGAPSLLVMDLADHEEVIREALRRYGDEASLWALVDRASSGRLLPALAAGCVDYLFYPLNRSELRLRWNKHREGRSGHRGGDGDRAEGRLELAFPSEVRHLRPAVDQVVDACEMISITGSRADLNLRVAVGEAISNAILYGNREDPEKLVRLRAEFAPDRVRVTVSDEGEGFDPEAVDDPTRPENRDSPHGRGIFLMRELMDAVEYSGKGNRVTLVLDV